MSKQPMKKILRVGVIQGGRIVEEKLVRKREDVTIGQSAKNTFILPSSHLSKSYKIFEAKGESYFLAFDDSMEGRVSLHDQVLDLKSVAKSGEVKKKGGRYLVELDDNSRGKVQMGEFTLLFQFVDKPPVLPRMQLPAEATKTNIDWLQGQAIELMDSRDRILEAAQATGARVNQLHASRMCGPFIGP